MASSELAPGYDLQPAWRLGDRQIEADAVAFWNRLGILPAEVKAEERARELAAVAYHDGRIVGVQTAVPARLDIVRARLAMVRSAVDPEHRRSHVGMALAVFARDLLEQWSKDHPEERLAGLGAVIEGPNLFERAREPFWPQTRFGVVGYMPDGRQIRVSWFEHHRLD